MVVEKESQHYLHEFPKLDFVELLECSRCSVCCYHFDYGVNCVVGCVVIPLVGDSCDESRQQGTHRLLTIS